VPREAPKEVPPREVPKEIVKEVPREVPKETPKPVAKEVPKEVAKEAPKQVAREVPKEVPKEIPIKVAREVPKEPPKEVAKGIIKEVPKEVSAVTLHPGEDLTMWTKGGRVISSRTSPLAKEEEVKHFFSNYVDRYNRRDVGGFLSLFSSRAIQNRTDRSEAIRNFYTTFFNQSQDVRYQIEGMKIDISQSRVDVKARFRVDQKLKKDGEEKLWKGNVRWVLVKEEGRLKISSLDYQNEKGGRLE
jgi:ketosteroid isomerase-like protein